MSRSVGWSYCIGRAASRRGSVKSNELKQGASPTAPDAGSGFGSAPSAEFRRHDGGSSGESWCAGGRVRRSPL
jgi:hypothetical protein